MMPRYLRFVQALAVVSGATALASTGCMGSGDDESTDEGVASEDVASDEAAASKATWVGCGDGICQDGETDASCAWDCSCGNGTCDPDYECEYNISDGGSCIGAATTCERDCALTDCLRASLCIEGPLAPPDLPALV